MRNKITLRTILVSKDENIKYAMRIIDKAGLRVAYVVDEKDKLMGIVSDSEIRKAIIKGMDIREPVGEIVNPTPIILTESDLVNPFIVQRTIRKLIQKMPDSTHILVVDDKFCPKELVPIGKFLEPQFTEKRKTKRRTKNILIVGGAGYLGTVLVQKLLRKGYNVKALDILLYGSDHLNALHKHPHFTLIEGDMRHIPNVVSALEGIDTVVNLAAIVGDPACKNKPEQTIETNYLANKVLADACKYYQINRYIYASTCSVYGQMDGEDQLTENAPLNPVSLYSRSKIHSEEGILRLEDENFAPTILRMSTLYGYSLRMRFDLVVNTMTKNAIVDKKIIVHGGGRQWRPLLHVDDAAKAYIKCIEAPLAQVKGEIFNVGSDKENYQIITIAKRVKEFFPSAKLLIQKSDSDNRNYAVSFEKIRKSLRYTVSKQLDDAILTIKKAIENKVIKDPNESRYYNVPFSI